MRKNYAAKRLKIKCPFLLDHNKDGVRKNWADGWCSNNPGACPSFSCAHSKSLNCILKGKAFWWMLARLAGWNPQIE